MSQQTKAQPSELSTMEEPTQPLQPAAVNRTGAPGQHSTRLAKTARIKHSTRNLKPKLSSPITSDSESVKVAANILPATLPTLIQAGLVKKMRHESGNMVLVFPSTLWTDEIRLKG